MLQGTDGQLCSDITYKFKHDKNFDLAYITTQMPSKE